MWNKVGMGRKEAGLKEAIAEITALKEEFYKEVNVPGNSDEFNQELEKALRVADFIDCFFNSIFSIHKFLRIRSDFSGSNFIC